MVEVGPSDGRAGDSDRNATLTRVVGYARRQSAWRGRQTIDLVETLSRDRLARYTTMLSKSMAYSTNQTKKAGADTVESDR